MKKNSAFTMMEMLMVIAIISIMATLVIIAINPSKQMAQGRNTQRAADVNSIQKALYQYVIDGNPIPTSITSELQDICRTGQTGDCI